MPDGPGGFGQDSSCPALLRIPLGRRSLRVQDYHPLWCDFPDTSARDCRATARSYNPACAVTHTVWALPRSLATTGGIISLFSLPGGTKMFQFPPFAYTLQVYMTVLLTAGLSHSEISGSKVICTSPELVAAYHVLRRLLEPRHPPCALSYFLRLSSCLTGYVETSPHKDIAHTFSCIEIYQNSTVLSVTTCQRSFKGKRAKE